ncbi:hypothetical protein LCGC14_2499560, partial [marine sediment metagenome]
HGKSSEMTVEGRSLLLFSKSMQFGPYHVTDVHRGWTRGKGFSIVGYSASEAEQKYEFSVNESGRTTWEVQCTTGADMSKLKMKGFLGGSLTIESSSSQLACSLKKEGSEKPSKLVMSQSAKDTALKGIMTDGATQIDISVTHKLDTSSFKMSEPTGYVFSIKGRPVGAVEVINKGTVWFNNSVKPETRSALAATSAVLLLYQDITKTGK